jgi:hypothetical protein
MAQKVQVLLVDDIDGGSADETVQFGLDGASYEIDLSSDNARKLRDLLAPYRSEARKTGGTRGSTGRKRASRSDNGTDAGAVREWARANGYEVSERGRVSRKVREAYAAAQS